MINNLLYLLDVNNAGELCNDLGPVLRVVGILVLGIKIIVPIMLIIIGMLDMVKAVGEKDEGNIKKAQNALIRKAIAAVIVFLVPTIVALLMNLLAQDDYKKCLKCINSPFDCEAQEEIE